MNFPWLTIGVTTYRRPLFLKRCLKSLERQVVSKDSFVVIVHNDSPEEVGYESIRRWAEDSTSLRIKWLMSDNIGVQAARNKILDLAQTPYSQFCDDDDWLLPNHLHLLSCFADETLSRIVVASSIERHANGSIFLKRGIVGWVKDRNQSISQMCSPGVKSNSYCFPTPNRSLRYNPAFEVDEDFFFQILLTKSHTVVFLENYTSVVECRNMSMTSEIKTLYRKKFKAYYNFRRLNKSEGRLQVIETHYRQLLEHAIPFLSLRFRLWALCGLGLPRRNAKTIVRLFFAWK